MSYTNPPLKLVCYDYIGNNLAKGGLFSSDMHFFFVMDLHVSILTNLSNNLVPYFYLRGSLRKEFSFHTLRIEEYIELNMVK